MVTISGDPFTTSLCGQRCEPHVLNQVSGGLDGLVQLTENIPVEGIARAPDAVLFL